MFPSRIALAVTAFASLVAPAFAANWTASSGGNWAYAPFWNTKAVPGTGEDVSITLASFSDLVVIANTSYTPTGAIGDLLVSSPRPSEITLSITDIHSDLFAANETIGDAGHAVVHHTGHSTNGIAGTLTLGKAASGKGTYEMGGLYLNAGLGEVVGLAGTGVFTQMSGTNTIGVDGYSDGLKIGASANAHGTYNQSGGTLNVGGNEYVGLLGFGAFNQTGGTNNASLLYTDFPTATAGGTYTLGGGTLNATSLQNYNVLKQTGGALNLGYGTNYGSFESRGVINVTSGFTNVGTATFGGAQNWRNGVTFTNLDGSTTFETDAGSPAASPLNVSVAAGGVLFISSQHLSSMTASGSGRIAIAPSTNAARNVVTVGQLGLVDTAQLDLANNELIARSADVQSIRTLLLSGYDNGVSPGAGITTILGDAQHRIGYRAIDGGGVDIRFTVAGDTDLDGTAGFSDLVALAQNYGFVGRTWETGDLDYNGTTDFADLVLLAQNYGGSASLTGGDASFAADWALAQSLLPEPVSLLAIVPAALMIRRRR